MIDIEKALFNPTSVFKSPEEVIYKKELSREQKIKILCQWEYDIREQQVAEEEGMMGHPQTDILDRVLGALNKLGAAVNCENSPPTKQGGG